MKTKFLTIVLIICGFANGCKNGIEGDLIYKPYTDGLPKYGVSAYSFIPAYPLDDTKEVFLINTSKDKKLKFTIKENIKSCLFDSDNKKPIWKNVKTNSSDRFKILEPGEETSLGFDKYRIYINNEYDKDNYFDDKDREARNYINSCSYLLDYSSKHEEYYCEFSYEIVGARQTKE